MSSDPYADLLTKILVNQEAMAKEIQEIKAKISASPAPVSQTGGLYAFKRPDPVEPRYGFGIKMTSPDVAEALKRAVYCVDWAGDQKRSSDEDAVWAEITKLQTSTDPKDFEPYALLDPEFAGFALLTNLIQTPASDAASFGQTKKTRESYAGTTVQSFLEAQFGIHGGPSGA